MPGKPNPPKIRFWEKVNKNGSLILDTPCWEWTASTFSNGYGQFFDGNNKIGAHRFSYKINKDTVPDSLQVCHICDNRLCVNPDHLFLGTAKDNLHDMARKGRKVNADTKGVLNGRATITDSEVLEMRALYDKGTFISEIAKRFDVSETQTARIVKRQSWQHI